MKPYIIYLGILFMIPLVQAIPIFNVDIGNISDFAINCTAGYYPNGIMHIDGNTTFQCVEDMTSNVTGTNTTIYINTTIEYNNTINNSFDNGSVTNIVLTHPSNNISLQLYLTNGSTYIASIIDNSGPSIVFLNDVVSPTANTEWNMGIFSLNISFTGALAKGIDIDGTGAFTDDLLHIHQHSGNVPAGTDLLHIEAEDVDARGINVTTAGEESIRANHNITADWFNGKVNASNIMNSPYVLQSGIIMAVNSPIFFNGASQSTYDNGFNISMPQANDTAGGFLSATDHTWFGSKLNDTDQRYNETILINTEILNRINNDTGIRNNATLDNTTQANEIALRLRNNSIKDYYNDGIVINLTNGETLTGALNVTAPNGSYINIVSHNSNPSGIMLINGSQQLGHIYASADYATAFPATSLHLRSPTVNGISMETSQGWIARFGITQIQFITQALNMSNHDIFAVQHLNVSEIFLGTDFTVSHQLLNVTGITTTGDIKMQERGSIYDAINVSLDNMLVINGTQYTIIEKSSVGATQWNISIPTGYRSAMIKMLLHPSNPAVVGMRFNNDNALNYASRRSQNSGADATAVSSKEFNITTSTSASTFISATIHIDGLDNSGTTVGTFQTQDRGNTVATAFNRWEGGFAYFNASNLPITTINVLTTASFQTDGVAYITLYK